jgi:rhodanese-related sulfurtransferase
MPTPVDRIRVQQLVAAGALLVEVLPREEYEDEHLPGAISIPLKDLRRTEVEGFDRSQPVIVYCWDSV